LPPDVTEIKFLALNEDSRYSAGIPNRAERFAHVKDISTQRPGELALGDISLQHYQIVGRLVNMVTMRPAGSVQFAVESRHALDAEHGWPLEHAKSSDDSRIKVDRLRLDAPVLDLKVNGYLPKVFEKLPAPQPDGVIDLGDILLDPGQTVWGVLRGPNGELVKRGNVGIRDVSGNSQGVDTDDQGVFVITGLLPGDATAYASAYHHDGANEWIIVTPNNQGVHLPEHRFKIEPGAPAMLELRLPKARADE
jgi:hypothetical protein